MQTPLDRYRLLGIPYQATSEQIQQAYRDRSQQQPPGGYSPTALGSRAALLKATYEELSDPERRAAYDRTLITAAGAKKAAIRKVSRRPTLPPTQLEAVLAKECRQRQGPTLAIPSEHFLGALLLLVEMGEYVLVQDIARACFQDEAALEQMPRADLALAATLALRERGRELWQHRHYRHAAAQLEMARQLAETEAVGTMVQQDVASDLCRLRPYEIWELLTVPKRTESATKRALALLAAMLDERGGLDGATVASDRSGLSATEFLRFIQQLRPYLDAEEQFRLFERESRRPSGTAACLLAYTQIARGFAGFRPEFLLEAASILEKIGQRRPHQDVQIEKAICALLLGRTEAATAVLQQSRDRKARDFIDRASEGAPDLLPGLCEFAKQWLQAEVLPEFRDLSQRRVTLAEYFADRQVQATLDRLAEAPAMRQRLRQPRRRRPIPAEAAAMPLAVGQSRPQFYPSHDRQQQEGSDRAAGPVMTAAAPAGAAVPSLTTAPGIYGDFSEALPAGGGAGDRDEPRFVPFAPGKRRRSRPQGRLAGARRVAAGASALMRSQQTLAGWALAFVGAAGIAIAFAGIWTGRDGQEEAALPALAGEQLLVRLDAPPAAIADLLVAEARAEAAPTAAPEPAADTVEDWLTAKARAYGPEYEATALATVLAGAPLAQHQQWVAALERQGRYREFEHEIAAGTVRTLSETDDRAIVEATVREVATDLAHEGGNGTGAVLYDANLRVRYELARAESGVWKINAIQVLEKLP